MPLHTYPSELLDLNYYEKLAISGFSVGAHIIFTNNTDQDKNDSDKNQKQFTLNSHMILREKNHQEVKDKITKKFKVPRDIREDFLI